MNKMKICFPIGRFYPSQVGGPCNTVYWHTCALKSKGIKTSIITTGIGIKEGLVDLDVPYDENCGTVYYGSGSEMNFKTLKRMRNELKTSDIVHLNSLFSFFSIFSFFYSRMFLKSKKIIISVRGELSPSALKYGKAKKKIVLLLYKIFNKGVLYHSTADKEAVEIKNVFINADVINIPNLIEPAVRLDVHKKKQFLFIGRIHPIKAIDKLLEGLLKSDKFKKSDFKLLIVGQASEGYESYYRGLKDFVELKNLKHKIEFAGHKIGDEKETLIAESYFTFLPSETENFGNVVLESLNQSTPVVASLGTPWSLLEDYHCGFHISNDVVSLSNIIDVILSLTPEEYVQFTINSRRLIDEKFNVNNQIHNWVEAYKNVYVS